MTPTLYDFEYIASDGTPTSLKKFSGKAVLIVNIATRCGYTPQLKDLQDLHLKYQEKGLVIVGLPANEFGGQTPESNSEVTEFCKLNYGVTFPLSKKMIVKGADSHPLAIFLNQQAKQESIKWNFEKFLFDRKGQFKLHAPSGTKPLSPEFIQSIEAVL